MSTNYYFYFNPENIKINYLFSNFDEEFEDILNQKLIDFIEQISIIPIGQRSAGWKPLFHQTDYYCSVQGIRDFYEANKDNLIILDEYDKQLTFEELEKQLINWNKHNQKAKNHEGLSGVYEDDAGNEFFTGSD